MQGRIEGPAEDIKFEDIQEVSLGIERILLATDGSEPAVMATQYAVTLAKKFNASIMAIYVDDGFDALELPEDIENDDSWGGHHPAVKGLGIARIMAKRNGVPVEVAIVRGNISKLIITTAHDGHADLIVLGETGRTGLKRLGMGSIAETVIKGSETPVLVIK